VKIEADSDSMLEYPQDDMQTMGMSLFIALYGSKNNIAFVSVFCCDHDNSWTAELMIFCMDI